MKKLTIGILMFSLAIGLALASYEKDAANLIKKNPNLPPEIVEGLKMCQLVKGMDEKQARRIGKEWVERFTRPAYSSRNETVDEDGHKLVEIIFHAEIDARTTLVRTPSGRVEARTDPAQDITQVGLFFTDGALTKWTKKNNFGEIKDSNRAKIRSKVELELKKLESKPNK